MNIRPLLMAAALLMGVSCSNNENPDPSSGNGDNSGNNNSGQSQTKTRTKPATYQANSTTPATDFTTNSQSVSPSNPVIITFNTSGGVDVTNSLSAAGVTVTASGQHVIVNAVLAASTTEASYVISGATTNGSVKIYSDYKFGLMLNGADIKNPSGSAINIQSGKKVSVTLVASANNRLIDGSSYTMFGDEDQKATLFSEGQLVFSGTGNLLVYGNYKHAICSDDYIRIDAGNITVNNSSSDGIHAKDYFEMNGGTVTIESSSDGIESEDYILVTGGTIAAITTGQSGKTLKSAGDCTLSGGTIGLRTTANAAYDSSKADIVTSSGIKCDGNFAISGGCELTIYSTGSAGKGISVEGTTTFDGGKTLIETWGDYYKYGNLDSSPKAVKSEGNLVVNSGEIDLYTCKEGGEGLESKSTLTINGGLIEIETWDDCLNAATNITINGGQVYCYSSDNDGIDSNGTLTITGGTVVSSGTKAPEEGFDCDQNTFKVTGGTIVGVGGATSMPTASACTQRVIVCNTSSVSSGQMVSISSSAGQVLTLKVPRAYSSMVMVFSSPQVAANTSYTIYKGGSVGGGTDFHGLYTGATYSGGSKLTSITTSSMVTTYGNVGNQGGQGGGPGGK